MSVRGSNLPLWKIKNGWREVFARVFEGVVSQFNVTPEWLVNPTTKRRLKLDMFYPDIGVAVRFEGLSGKDLRGKRRRNRPSLEEEAQQRARDEARVSVSQQHGTQLIIVNIVTGKPQAVFQQIDAALGRVQRHIEKTSYLPKIKAARVTAARLARKISYRNDLGLYADLWEDRQYRVSEPAKAQPSTTPTISYAAGMAVEHTIFGPGIVLATTPSNGDTLVTVNFDTAGPKTLAASLIGDKLLPR
jgi:hypothetical protein